MHIMGLHTFQGMSLDRSVTCVLPYTKELTQPRHDSPPPLVTMTSICRTEQHIHGGVGDGVGNH
jgi:hypothetical protein